MPDPETTTLIEAIHDLRESLDLDLRSAISEMINVLATGQLPPAKALVGGIRTQIPPQWWWAASIEYPNSSATFRLVDGAERLTRATTIRLDRVAWENRRTHLVPEPTMEEWARDRIKEPDNMASPEEIMPESISPQRSNKRQAYAERVAEFRRAGIDPPLGTTKTGIQGDREWAKEEGISRPTVEKWRADMVPDRRRGRRPNNPAK